MKSRAARVICRLIERYQLICIDRPPTCRFAPSCSSYALEAVQRHGAFKGVWLAVRRLLRCHPSRTMRVDLVPSTAPDLMTIAGASKEKSDV